MSSTSQTYAPAAHQLVLEIYVSNLDRSREFYHALGFKVDWIVPGIFTQLSWEQCIMFLKVKASAGSNSVPAGNIRMMIPDVDAKYEECKKLGYSIQQDIGDRLYVLRDFIITDPDGWEVRFGTFLPGRGKEEQTNGPDAEGVIREIKS